MPGEPGSCRVADGAEEDDRGRRAGGQHGTPPGTRRDTRPGAPRPGRLCHFRRSGRQAADPAGDQIPAVHFGTAVLAAGEVFAGPVMVQSTVRSLLTREHGDWRENIEEARDP